MLKNNKHIGIISTCIDDWGGSEELWARAIPYFKSIGYRFTLYKDKINFNHPEIKGLMTNGVSCKEIKDDTTIVEKLKKKIHKRLLAPEDPICLYSTYNKSFKERLKKDKPSFVIIAQGINFDGLGYAYQCMLLKIPYCIIIQKAVDFFWPPATERVSMVEVLKKAARCYFVSHHNLTLTEEQFGLRFTNAEVVWNPIKLKLHPIAYPENNDVYQIACVGRLFIIDKGQDILLRILAREPWKSRPIKVSFFGSGIDENGLKELAQLLNLPNVEFCGFSNSMEDLWKSYHALILPSRSEGMALSVLEAMACGRTAIVTTAGGHAEIIQHKTNGFIGDATVKDFERVMEDAWNMREEWEQIGLNANAYICNNIPKCPEKEFAESVKTLLNEKKSFSNCHHSNI